MSGLDSWLRQATRHLAKDSAAQVRMEIQTPPFMTAQPPMKRPDRL